MTGKQGPHLPFRLLTHEVLKMQTGYENDDLQIAEYMRVELLRDLTEMTKALGMADPNFPTPALTVGKVRDTQTQ